MGALRRDERVSGRRLDRRPLGDQAERHLLSRILRLRHAVENLRRGLLYRHFPARALHLRAQQSPPPQDGGPRDRHGPRFHRQGQGPGRMVAVLYDRSGRRARLHPRHHQQDERDERPVQVLVPAGRLPGGVRRGQLQRDGVETRRGRPAAVPHHRALPRHAVRCRPAFHRGRDARPVQRRRAPVRPAARAPRLSVQAGGLPGRRGVPDRGGQDRKHPAQGYRL